MKFGKIMRLWTIGMMLLSSVVVYAAEEDTLTVSSTDTPGIYEITISGTRDSDTAKVRSLTVTDEDRYCEDPIPGCEPFFSVEAFIETGKNPGRSTYQMKRKIFLQPGSSRFVFYSVRNFNNTDYRNGKVILPQDQSVEAWGRLYFTPPGQLSVNLSLQNVTAEITGTDSFTLRNLGAELGSGEKFSAWGKFQWNPSTLSWTLKDAGVEK